ARTAIRTIANVEDGLMGHTAGNIVGVTTFSKVNIVAGCALSVADEAMKQRNLAILLAHEHMAKSMRHGKGAQRADGVGKERVRAIERENETLVAAQIGPARGLNGTAYFPR